MLNKNTLLILVLALLVTQSGFCQKAPMKFGDVPVEDLKMVSYAKDSSASAVILVDYGSSTINYHQADSWFKLDFERMTRIKILTKDGYSHADFEVPIYQSSSGKEKLIGLKVTTYNLENGKIVESKMKSDGVFEEKYDQNTTIVKFTAPNVKEGSIIEVTYKINSDFLNYLRDWEFQSTIPVVWSEYRTHIPEYFHYEKFMQGYIALHIVEGKDVPRNIITTSKERSDGRTAQTTFQTSNIDYQEKFSRWVAKDVPAFRSEPFITTYIDYISKINFELAYYKFPNQLRKDIMGTWADLTNTLLESQYFGAAIKGSSFLKKITDDITNGLESPAEKVSAIYSYVKYNIEWDGRYRKYLDDNSLKSALDSKKGSTSHINLTLVSMLQKAGFNSNPVILSTRNHGFVRENIALSSQFNYVIAQVIIDDKSILLDATDRLLPIDVLPERCLNGRGYVISKENPGWVELTAPKTRIAATTNLNLTDDGKFKGEFIITSDGYFARNVRNTYFSQGEEEYAKKFQQGKPFTVTTSEFSNANKLDMMMEEKYVIEMEQDVELPNMIFLSPILYLKEDTNPFKLEKREYPVNFGSPFERTLLLSMTLPDNYEIDEIPKSKIFSLPNGGGRYLYNVNASGNVINITSMLSINKGLYTQDEYPGLREFYNLVVAKQAEQIVLKKK